MQSRMLYSNLKFSIYNEFFIVVNTRKYIYSIDRLTDAGINRNRNKEKKGSEKIRLWKLGP